MNNGQILEQHAREGICGHLRSNYGFRIVHIKYYKYYTHVFDKIQRSEETEILNLSKIRMYHAIPIITLSSVFDYAIQSLLVKPFFKPFSDLKIVSLQKSLPKFIQKYI